MTSEAPMEEDEAPDAQQLKANGNEQYSKKNYTEAYSWYNKAVEKDPENAQLYGNRSAASMMLKRYSDVVTDCKKAIELDPGYLKAYGRMAKAYFLMGDLRSALEAYNIAIEADPNSADLKNEKNIVEQCQKTVAVCKQYLEKKDGERALPTTYPLIKEAPDAVPFLLLHYEAYCYARRAEQASAKLAELMRADPSNIDIVYIRAIALYYCGNNSIQQAVSHLQRVLEWDPDHNGARTLMKLCRKLESLKAQGNAHFKAKEWAQAITAYTEAIELDPTNTKGNSVLYCNRAAAKKEVGQTKEAIDDCTKAIELDDKYEKAFIRRGRCYLSLDEFDNAVRDFSAAHQINPSHETSSELREAKMLQKRSKKKDYYKILKVSRDADEKEIKKAYREQALKLHPDKMAGCDAEEKAKAEQQFKEVGEAYSVLTDPVKKRKYDNGTYDDGSGDMGDGMNMSDASELFNVFFGGGGGPQMFFGGGGGGSRRGRGGTHFSFNMG